MTVTILKVFELGKSDLPHQVTRILGCPFEADLDEAIRSFLRQRSSLPTSRLQQFVVLSLPGNWKEKRDSNKIL